MAYRFDPENPQQWQLDRMRRAMRIFGAGFKFKEDMQAPITKTQRQTWQNLIDEIHSHTGVKLAEYEAVRRFVVGNNVNVKPEENTFPEWKPHQLEAVYRFLQPISDDTLTAPEYHEDDEDWHPWDQEPVALLMPNIVLDDLMPDVQIPFYMAEFLRDGKPCDGSLDFSNFEGFFLAEKHSDEVIDAYHLTLENPIVDGMLQVTLIHEKILKTKDHDPDKTVLDYYEAPELSHHSKGWAFVTADYDLVFLMKKWDGSDSDVPPDMFGQPKNMFFTTLALSDGVDSGERLDHFALVAPFDRTLPAVFGEKDSCLQGRYTNMSLKCKSLIFNRYR